MLPVYAKTQQHGFESFLRWCGMFVYYWLFFSCILFFICIANEVDGEHEADKLYRPSPTANVSSPRGASNLNQVNPTILPFNELEISRYCQALNVNLYTYAVATNSRSSTPSTKWFRLKWKAQLAIALWRKMWKISILIFWRCKETRSQVKIVWK